MSIGAGVTDPYEARYARSASGLLRDFNQAGVLAAADVHVAVRLAALGGERDELVALAAALAVRAPRLGHVHVDLAQIRRSAAVESEDGLALDALPWPAPEDWVARVGASPLVASPPAAPVAPLRLEGTRLYLDRYWSEEIQVAQDLLAMSVPAPTAVDEAGLAEELSRLFAGDAYPRQRLAAATAVLRRLSVIAGGPGTGKTTTVASVLALLLAQAQCRGARAPLIALAAPTGKASARLEEAVHEQALALDLPPQTRTRLLGLQAFTLHRLLGRRPDSNSRFRHDRHQHLPFDVVVVDETSMVPLSLMARLVAAVRPSARLVLVGDPGQLASIEAGAVLGDIVGPAAQRLMLGPAARERLAAVTGSALRATHAPGAPEPARPGGADAATLLPGIGDGIIVLDRVYRYGGAIATLAEAVRTGDAERVLERLDGDGEEIVWLRGGDDDEAPPGVEVLREAAGAAAASVIAAAQAGNGRAALSALGDFRLLCAHRRGPFGVAAFTAHIESWLAAAGTGPDRQERWYPGRPVLVTENDYELGLYNGDTGVVIARPDGGLSVAFERRGEIIAISPTRLGAADTVYAMTVHKSQGSQFGVAAVVLPPPESRILSRELLYTAVTRAQRTLMLAGSEASIRAAVARPVARASGLGERLWGPTANQWPSP
ncbi:MAG: exodeoxyribonuclease alpha subunit [Solirubrobacteraceae bacterium]|nr:exodeoxyribonuclease alpha subunit [Solirubrobacteraceae bacterium]